MVYGKGMRARDSSEALETGFILTGKQHYSGGHAESIGPRPSMEDACAIAGEFAGPNTHFYGLYDGHGGTEVSFYCAKTLHRLIARGMKDQSDMVELITDVFAEVNSCCSKWPLVGCTAAIAIIIGDDIWTANVGDSRVIIVENGKAERLTYDHKVSDPEERAGVISRGGYVLNGRVNGILMLARAIGDTGHGDAVGCVPCVRKVQRKDGMKMIIACDGVWDVMEDQEAADIAIQIKKPVDAAKAIKDEALRRGSQDNVSCVVVNLTPKEREELVD